MALTFYALSGSPFSWKVWLALEHKRLSYDLRILSKDAGDLKSPAYAAINPRGKVPVIDDNGFVLRESGAILEYLEDRYVQSGALLWPADIKARALARRMSLESDAYIYPHVRKLVVEILIRRDGLPDMAVIDDAKSALRAEFSTLGAALSGPFATGSEPSAADFALYPLTAILNRIQSRRAEFCVADVLDGRIRQWMAEIEALPYFGKTIPPLWRQT